ncbi:alpha/beta hydrolase [Azorhizobium oxalatiphilum]|uniref:Alpha/beta hydrolase n=1 Tax=Azorhizobium oxalatiphilum TaxID=980631 RepID=A0A917F993_9HYPH|nr:alpha/beta fold hydrolase [Azorhizobium oxalatiphilum]GGF57164.1 alpha/beta hydrolase [Azorhizobium oxalatiphilum]
MNWIGLDHVTLRYTLSGRGEHTLVLLHELGGTLESFDGLMPALEQRFRVLRYDQRGAGWSEKPRAPFFLADHISDLRQLLAMFRLTEPVMIAGVAAGAAIAVSHALETPHAVSALALCAPALTVASERVRYLAERSERAISKGMAAITDTSLDRSFPPVMRRDPAAYLAYRARFLANDPVGYAHANMALADVRLEERLGQLIQPCLVLSGTHDLLRPPEAVRQLAALIPHATYAEIDSGHIMPVQAPEEMAARLYGFFTKATHSPLVRA